ncbi:MAG: hypothetical protein D6816_04965 [Bacteroidetes bacterium]|nr:MAG: hypothetical protein D6816_04965 [Bacteroidota bacterium]
MKGTLSVLLFLAAATVLSAQSKEPSFTVKLSTDSVLMGNYFQVQFILEGGNGTEFQEPDFSQDFNIVSGPSQSMFTTIVNGEMSQRMTISFYLEPKQEGLYYIGPASIRVDEQVLETEPVEVLVVPNPDGIKQSPEMENPPLRFEFGSPFDHKDPFFDDPLFDIPRRMTPPGRDSIPAKPKKKRKTIRI